MLIYHALLAITVEHYYEIVKSSHRTTHLIPTEQINRDRNSIPAQYVQKEILQIGRFHKFAFLSAAPLRRRADFTAPRFEMDVVKSTVLREKLLHQFFRMRVSCIQPDRLLHPAKPSQLAFGIIASSLFQLRNAGIKRTGALKNGK